MDGASVLRTDGPINKRSAGCQPAPRGDEEWSFWCRSVEERTGGPHSVPSLTVGVRFGVRLTAPLIDGEAPEERGLFAGFYQARRRRYRELLVRGREDVAGSYAGHPHRAFRVDVNVVDALGSCAGDVARID